VWQQRGRLPRLSALIRSSILVDEKRKVIAAWYKVKAEDTVPAALEALKTRCW
jgi:peroxiredoxin